MSKMNISAILIPLYIIIILLIVGCASTSRPEYVGRTVIIPLKSSPEGARVLLDGQQKGYTPMTLEFTYLIGSDGNHSDETGERIVTIEKEGYEPYVLSFSTKGKEYKTMPRLIFIKKLDDVIKAEDSVSKDQEIIQELKESRKKAKEALDEIERLRKEIALLKEKKDSQEIIHEPIEVLSAADRIEKGSEPKKDIVPDREYKNDDNANNSNKKTMADGLHASQEIYTIQTGSFLEIELAQKEGLYSEEELYTFKEYRNRDFFLYLNLIFPFFTRIFRQNQIWHSF